jgi:hypothetical protein
MDGARKNPASVALAGFRDRGAQQAHQLQFAKNVPDDSM